MKSNSLIFFVILWLLTTVSSAQSGKWKLWASGLPPGAYPRMVVAPNHDLFYTLLGTGVKLGYIYKANTQDSLGAFTALPPVPRPSTIQNNIVALGYNLRNEPLAGIYRTNTQEPWLFTFNNNTQSWDTAISDQTPTLGGQCIATSQNGNIYVGTRWAYIYKSTDHGRTFKAIDEAKLLDSAYPCYYPSFKHGMSYNGSIFGIVIDQRGRIYAGTEIAGLIYSDDEGDSWHPADLFACAQDIHFYDTLSPMYPLALSGNVAGIGFTKDHNVIWSGNDMWTFGWKNKLAFAHMKDSFVSPITGIPDYLIQTGQQISKIVTTQNGMLFLHSGGIMGANLIGIYRSNNGIEWEYFNDGINGLNQGLSQGSLAVDGNKVFMATQDGMVWMYDASGVSSSTEHPVQNNLKIFPNPAASYFSIQNQKEDLNCQILSLQGTILKHDKTISPQEQVSIEDIPQGIHFVKLTHTQGHVQYLSLIKQ